MFSADSIHDMYSFRVWGVGRGRGGGGRAVIFADVRWETRRYLY